LTVPHYVVRNRAGLFVRPGSPVPFGRDAARAQRFASASEARAFVAQRFASRADDFQVCEVGEGGRLLLA
jgi:hypothetical protein